MPFRSEAQRRWMYANDPEMARRWQKHTPTGELPEHVTTPKKMKAKLERLQYATPAGPVTAPRMGLKGKLKRCKPCQLAGKMEQPIAGGFTREEAKRTAKRLGIDFSRTKFSFSAFLQGMNIEREHADVTHSAKNIAKIALAHLRERADYYDRLKEVEHGKMSPMMVRQDGWGAQGDAPRQQIPDYASIYYQPDDPAKRKREQEDQLNRRRSLGAGEQKYGFHGLVAPQDEPVLRYVVPKDNLHGQPVLRQREPIVRAPKLVSSKAVLRGKLAARR